MFASTPQDGPYRGVTANPTYACSDAIKASTRLRREAWPGWATTTRKN